MVGTYKYGGKEVSEATFKKKQYGADSRAYKSAVAKEEAQKRDLSRAGSGGSNYVKYTSKDGTVSVRDKHTGEVISSQTAEQAKEANKNVLVIGVGKDETGRTKVENVGQYLTEEQRREVSRLTEEKGRLTTKEIKETQSVNAQGQTVSERSVQFGYTEKGQSDKVTLPTDERPPDHIEKLAQKRFRSDPNTHQVTIGEWVFTRTGKTEVKEVPEFIGSKGVVDVAEKPKGFYNKLVDKKERLLDQVDKSDAKQESSFLAGGALFGIGVVEGVYNVGRMLIRPDKFVVGVYNIGKETVKDPLYLPRSLATEFARNPSGFIGEVVGSVGVLKALSVGAKASLAKYKSPKVVGEGSGNTLKIDLNKDLSKSTTESSSVIKSGSDKFKVDAVTKTVDRADDAGARLQSSTTDLEISKLNKKGVVKDTTSGFARGETVVSKADDGTLLARGDTVQATNVGEKSVVRQGDFTGLGQSFDDGSRMTSIVSTGKGVKGKVVGGADELSFVDDASKKVSSVESSSSKKVLEYDAPIKENVKTDFGNVEVSTKEVFKNTLYDDVSTARGGSYLSKADKSSTVKVDPYSQSMSQDGLGVSFKSFDEMVSQAPVKPKVSPDAKSLIVSKDPQSLILTMTDDGLVLSAKKIVSNDVPLSFDPSSSQALVAVGDVVERSLTRSTTTIDQSSKVVTPAVVATVLVSESSTLKPTQYHKVKGATPVSVSKTETKSEPVQALKTFSSSKVLTQQKTQSEAVLALKTRSRSKLAYATATVQATDVISSTQQKTSVVSLTTQKLAVRQRVVTEKVVPQQVLIGLVTPRPSPDVSRQGNGFDVFVRTRGVFQKISRQALGKRDAKDLGAYNVANTPQATFTLRPSSSPLGSISSRMRGSFNAFRSNFIQKGGLFIEKRGKRIKSGGEKAGITRKGILANKNKNLFKGLKL